MTVDCIETTRQQLSLGNTRARTSVCENTPKKGWFKQILFHL